MKKIVLIAVLASIYSNSHAGITDSLSIGAGVGYNSYKTWKWEFYAKSSLNIYNRNAEIKFGINNRNYQLTFDDIKQLDAHSIGLFGDIVVYPFNNGVLTGFRWEFMNFNWLSENSMNRIENERNYAATSLYTGTCIFLQVGYLANLYNNLNIKLYGQPGLQQFKITNGSSSSGNYVQSNPNDDIIIEDHYKFIYNLNLSIELRINQ